MDRRQRYTTDGLIRETPTRRETRQAVGQSRRKRVLMEILDALHELSSQDLEGQDLDDPMNELQGESEDIPRDDRSQSKGAQVFFMFRRSINDLDRELQNLAQAFRQIGSAGITSSSYQLRTRLSKVFFLFSENASEIFPEVAREHPPDVPRSALKTLKGFPEELERLAEDLITFLRYLREVPDSKQERLHTSVGNFRGDLKYWASCLHDFRGQFRDPAVQRYMHDICEEMDHHLRNVITSTDAFVKLVVPTIRVAQQQAATTLVSLSGLATFVSAVTATGIQVAFEQTEGPLNNAVNALWFSSLVFSVASAVNSLLVVHLVTGFHVWIRQSPLIFLVAALITFSFGLVLFTWASGQVYDSIHIITRLMTTAFTVLSSFGLLVFSAWFAFERLVFIRHNGQRLLADVIADVNADWTERIIPRFAEHLRLWIRSQTRSTLRAGSTIIEAGRGVCSIFSASNGEQDMRDGERGLPVSHLTSTPVPVVELHMCHSKVQRGGKPIPLRGFPSSATALTDGTRLSVGSTHADVSTSISRGELHPSGATDPFTNPKLSQITSEKYSLNMLETTQTLLAHQGTVSNLQFSSNGKWLASSSWDRTCVLFKTGSGKAIIPHQTLVHERPVHQIVCASDGRHLLTKLHSTGSIRVWTKEAVCVTMIERPRPVKYIAWLPRKQAFLSLEGELFSLEGSQVNIMDLGGNVLTSHHLPRLHLHDVAITPDEVHMWGVATVITSPDGLQPHRTRKESRIIVYNMAQNGIESQVPVSLALEIIQLSSNGQLALVSCNYGGENPTQLWRMDKFSNALRLSLSQTYMPSVGSDFAGPSYFGGKDDELVLVLCAGKNGHVNIYDRVHATLLHTLAQPDGDLTCVAWNPASESPMLATGSFDGTVRIWRPSREQQQSKMAVSRSASATSHEKKQTATGATD